MKISDTRRNILLFMVLALIQTISSAQHYLPGKYKNTPQIFSSVRVASASVVPEKWNREVNWTRTEAMVRKAVSEGGARVVITPECILDGYVVEESNGIKDPAERNKVLDKIIAVAEPITGTYILKACRLADELDVWLVFGFLESLEGKLYNTAILVDPDGDIVGRYCKTHFAEGYTIKPDMYTPGDDYPVFDTPFGKVGIIICYDRQLPEPARIMGIKGAQILFVPAYGSYTDENGWNTALMRTRAYENKYPLVFCHPFQSLMIDQAGNLKASGNAGEVVYYDFNTSPENYKGRFTKRRAETYRALYESGKQDL